MEAHPSLIRSLRGMPGALWFLCFGAFLNRFGTFVLPFLVLYLTRRGFTAAQAGLTLSIYGAGNLAASLIGGHLADRIGRRNTIVISMVSSAAATLALPQVESLPALMVISFCAGACSDLFRPASMAMIIDLSPPDQQLTAAALYRMAVHVGFAAGPVTGGLIVSRGFGWLFAADAATSLLFAALAIAALPRGTRHAAPPGEQGHWLAVAFRDRRFVRFLIAALAVTSVTAQLDSTLALHILGAGHPASTYGLLASVNAALIVVLEVGVTVITRRFRERPAMAVGYLFVGAGFALTTAATSALAIGLTIAVWTIGEMISSPLASVYVAKLAPAHLRGRYMGLYTAMWSLAIVIGPALGTLIFSSSETLLWTGCGVVGALAALLVLL
ncbi:MAG: MFS transporter [Deltaproteobacteria bacterium]|nr:MAG: MFS transporter [Deltaproteobacteria bacterium]